MKFGIDNWRPKSGRPAGFSSEFDLLRDEMDQMLNHFGQTLRGYRAGEARNPIAVPNYGAEETDQHYLLSFDLPGVPKSEIKVEIVGNRLCIAGERRDEHREKKGGMRTEERIYGKFRREIELPADVDPTKIEANYENGVLQIALPKSEKSPSVQIPIGEKYREPAPAERARKSAA